MKKQSRAMTSGRAARLRVWAWLICCILCGALVYTGLWCLSQNSAYQLDVTAENVSALSEGTTQTLDKLAAQGDGVTLHLIFQSATDTTLRTTLEALTASYARSAAVTVDVIDPVAEPVRISAYQTSGQTISEGSVIVASADGSRSEIVPPGDMYTYTLGTDGAYTMTGISAEKKLTAAIRAVTGEGSTRVYFLTGHGEAGLADCGSLVERLRGENYDVDEWSLGTGNALTPGDVLVILSPVRDLTVEEHDAITAFLDAGGRLLMGMDASVDMAGLAEFDDLIGRFSLSFGSGIVVESEQSADYWANAPLYLMPGVNTSAEAASGMQSGWRVIVPGSRPIIGPEIPLSGYTYETILSTSGKAYLKQTDSAAYTQEAGDPTGTYALAASVRHELEGTGEELRAVFLGTLYTTVDNSLMSSTYNLDLTVNLVGFLAQREDTLQVPVKQAADTTMAVPSTATAWRILAWTLCLPLLAVIVGAIVVIRRRH